jgi:hypothetical protein
MWAILMPTGEEDTALDVVPLVFIRVEGDKDLALSVDLQNGELTFDAVARDQALDSLVGKPILAQKSASTSSSVNAGDRPICRTSGSRPRADQAASSAVARASSTGSSSSSCRQKKRDPATGDRGFAVGDTPARARHPSSSPISGPGSRTTAECTNICYIIEEKKVYSNKLLHQI